MEVDREQLISVARKALGMAIAPLSGYLVGAALLTAQGKIYSGCNIENASLSLSLCAERVALLKALSEGEKEFKAIAIVSSGLPLCPPCGACRQMLYEFAPHIEVIMTNPKGRVISTKIEELLPLPFDH
ncbi:cytidine deaminase [bacterium (candidate division B38) B3_B38]|nr:MAG: cytidine deaminase [bacterium (candidate division B38) B3_B38]